MAEDVYYVPDAGLGDAQEYADQIDYFIEDSKVLDEETKLGKTGIGYGSYILQKAVENATERFTTRSVVLQALGKNVAFLMSSEMVRMVATDGAAADSVAGEEPSDRT